MKNFILHTLKVVFAIVTGVIAIYIIGKLYHRDERTQLSVLSMHEAMAASQKCSLDSAEYDVLCIGNSITRHSPYRKINWYSDHGMAASSPEDDYCHRLEGKLKELNRNSTVTGINVSHWERDFNIDKDSLLQEYCTGKDIIIVRLGENVTDTEHFKEALSQLIVYCKKYTDKIVLTGQYWTNEKKESAIISNARIHNIRYVPLDWIYELYREECSPRVGDIIQDVEGNDYRIEGDFLLSHPNDNGMELIAHTIYNSL